MRLHVEEDHNDVLHHLLRGVGAKTIPLEGNVILHWDSHPDMLLNRDMTPEDTHGRQEVMAACSIENWILPLTFMGIVEKVVWIRPPWSDQIDLGQYSFHIGRERETNRLRVTCLEPYFASEGIVSHLADMDRTKEVHLLVVQSNDEAIAKKVF